MVKIGMICWKQGGGTNDYILQKPSKPWKKGLEVVKKGKYKGKIPLEKAIISAMESKYDDIEIMYLNKFDEEKMRKNDINFLVSLNLLFAWEKGTKEYNRVYKLMKDPSINIYPNLKEQNFLFNKGDYLEYYKKKGIPIAPTFVVKKDRNINRIIENVKRHGWKSFVLKPHYAYANIGIGKFDIDKPDVKDKVSKYLTKHKRFPGFVCQEVMDGFAKFWEVKSFWLDGKFKYYVAMKAADKVFSEEKIYGENPNEFGKVSTPVLNEIKRMSKKIIKDYPKDLNKYSKPPMYLRIDFGCCMNNTMDGKSYFLNEIEFAGCATFSEESGLKNFTELWAENYYKKALEFRSKSSKRIKRTSKKTKRTSKLKSRRSVRKSK
jgi:hypothetical protein